MQRRIQMTKKFSLLLAIIFCATITTTLYQCKSPGSKQSGTIVLNQSGKLQLQVTEQNGNWSYQIFVDEQCLIAQEFIPGVPGNKKFTSKSDAEQCGQLVIAKLQARQAPSISKMELDSMKIKY